MRYIDTGFRAVYGNFIALPVNEKTRPSISGFPGEDSCNCILAYGFMDEKEGMSLEVVACGIGQGNNFRFYEAPQDVRSFIRMSSVDEENFFFIGNGDSHLAIRYADKLDKLSEIKPSAEIEETRMMTFLDGSRDPLYIDDVKVFLTRKGNKPEEARVRITGTGESFILGKLLEEPEENFGIHLDDTVAFFVCELEGGRIICTANMSSRKSFTKDELEDGAVAGRFIEAFRSSRNEDTYLDVIEVLRDSDVWVPCDISMEGEKLRMFPDILKRDGKSYFPVFTAEKEMDAYNGRFAKVRKTFLEAMDMAEDLGSEIEGIAVNPFTALFTVRRDTWHAVRMMNSRIEKGNS